jgi:hypothetical protein
MVGISFAIGNFMKRSDYDPNLDNEIAAAQIEGSVVTGAIVDYVDCADKELDNVAAEDTTNSAAYVNIGTPYTVTKADMDDKTNDIKVTLACETKTANGSYTVTTAYNIDGGGDVQIGAHALVAYTAQSVALVEVAVGEVIQWRLKVAGGIGYIQNMVITQTHAARKDYQVLGYY